jgi:dipeptidyl aminopeptidase/acylaminoacyl peptidase
MFYLKNLRIVGSHRIAVVGHSFGGQITLLEAEHDPTVRAVVTFGAAANFRHFGCEGMAVASKNAKHTKGA